MLSVQFIISLIWSDFLKPMGIGFIGLIAGIIAVTKGWEYAYLIPYGHATMVISTRKEGAAGEIFTQEIYASLIYAAVLFLVGYFIVIKKSVK